MTDVELAHSSDLKRPPIREVLTLGATLAAVGLGYFALARLGLMLALINPSATPIWPATGFAVAVVLLWGYRLIPAIFAGAFAANILTAGSLVTSAAIAAGNSLEALIIAGLVARWSNGRDTFARPLGVAKFSLIALAPGTMVSATVGVGALSAAGFAPWDQFSTIWMTWWLGDVTGALLFTPFVVLWVNDGRRFFETKPLQSIAIYVGAVAIGALAFSPLLEPLPHRGPLAFLALIPLVWAALRGNQRDTATASLILAAFAVWGIRFGIGPFATADPNFSSLMFLMFLISISVPSLALSADAAMRQQTEQELREAQSTLKETVAERDAMPNGGIFSMTASNAARVPDTPTGPLSGQFVAIALKDNGIGISPDMLNKVFDPFFTTKAVGKGTGLGLSQVYGFAHQSGGTVTIDSKAGLGTTVTLYLPRTEKAMPHVERAPLSEATAAKPARRLGRILVVEDNGSVAQVTQSLLEQIGYETVRAQSANDALTLLKDDQQFELVLSDIVMPGTINGIGLAERIKARYRDIPVLLTTGYSEGLKLAGSNFEVVRKPFVVSTLERAVQAAIAAQAGKARGATAPRKPSGTAGS